MSINPINTPTATPQAPPQRAHSDKDKDDVVRNGAVAPQSGTNDKDNDDTGVKKAVAVQKQESRPGVKQAIDTFA